jgi:hypothetical protein
MLKNVLVDVFLQGTSSSIVCCYTFNRRVPYFHFCHRINDFEELLLIVVLEMGVKFTQALSPSLVVEGCITFFWFHTILRWFYRVIPLLDDLRLLDPTYVPTF